jgi:hypothetical protein
MAACVAYASGCRSGAPSAGGSEASVPSAPAPDASTPDTAPSPPDAGASRSGDAAPEGVLDAGAGPGLPSDAAAALLAPLDGGTACRLLRGPIELPLKSAAAVTVRGDTLDVVLDDDGRPRFSSFPAGPLPPASPGAPPPAREPAAGGVASGYAVPCAAGGDRVFCVDHGGAVHRTARDGTGDRIVASSRSGSRVTAASLGGSHAALGYLASRQTTEGWVSEAWLAVDDAPPVRLSEDGSGATSLSFTTRGGAVLALSVDARSALTAMHVRPVTFENGAARLGEDAVVFVGGPGDRRTSGAVVAPAGAGPAWALLPISKDIGSFGLALVKLDDPPRVDEPVSWSMYPNGLDPAPISAAAAGPRVWAARVVPRDASPGSPRVLELGEILSSGAFQPGDVVPTTGKPTDVLLVGDGAGTLWLAWVDSSGSWLERLVCPAPASPRLPGR